MPDIIRTMDSRTIIRKLRDAGWVHFRTLDDIMADPDDAEAIPFPVAVRDRLDQAVQFSVTIPEADLWKVDALAKKRGKSRSAVLTEAARRMIAAEKDHAA
jgi:hypothetical protein